MTGLLFPRTQCNGRAEGKILEVSETTLILEYLLAVD